MREQYDITNRICNTYNLHNPVVFDGGFSNKVRQGLGCGRGRT